MTNEDSHNPYEPPKENPNDDPDQPPNWNGGLPVDFQLDRAPLIEVEEKCFIFRVEASTVESANYAKLAILWQVRNVLTKPSAIFSGLKRPNFENGFAYAGHGVLEYLKPYVLLVFVVYDEEISRLVVFDWEPRILSSNNAGCPDGWEEDFETRYDLRNQ
jgi:hypothetical protein